MDALSSPLSSSSPSLPPSSNKKTFSPNTDLIKHRLIRKGILPTPKILHTLKKKEIQKHNRRSKKPSNQQETLPSDEDTLFRKAKAEYQTLMGKPWKRLRDVDMAKIGIQIDGFSEKKLDVERLEDLRKVFAERDREILRGFVDDADLEGLGDGGKESGLDGGKWRRDCMEGVRDDEKIRLLARRYIAFFWKLFMPLLVLMFMC